MAKERKFRIGSGLRGVIAISSGTLVGQIIIAVATPILSRLYEPEAFGAYSALLALASVAGPAAALKFDSAVLLPSRDEDARGLLLLSLWFTFVTAIVAMIGTMFIGPVLLEATWDTIPAAALWVGFLVLTTGVFSTFVQVVLRAKSYSLVGWRATLQALGINITQIGFGLVSSGALWLVIGTVVGRTFGFGALMKGVLPLLRAEKGESARVLMRRYWRSPVLLAPSAVLNALGTQLPLVLVTALYGVAAAGQLSMAQRLVYLPAALIGAALAQVFGAEIAERLRQRTGGSRRLYLKATVMISAVAGIMFLAILLLSPSVLPFLLGGEWEIGGLLAQAMALSASIGLIVSPLSQVYSVHQSAASLIVDGSRVLLICSAAVLTQLLGLELIEAVWAIYAGQVVNYLITWVYGLRIVSRGEQ